MATRAEKIVEQLAIWGRGDRAKSRIDELVEEAVSVVQGKMSKLSLVSDDCEWCGKEVGSPVLLHKKCFEAILNGEGMI